MWMRCLRDAEKVVFTVYARFPYVLFLHVSRRWVKTPASCRRVDVSRELINSILDYLVVVHTEEVETNHVFIKLHGGRVYQPLEYADVNDLFQRLKQKTG